MARPPRARPQPHRARLPRRRPPRTARRPRTAPARGRGRRRGARGDHRRLLGPRDSRHPARPLRGARDRLARARHARADPSAGQRRARRPARARGPPPRTDRRSAQRGPLRAALAGRLPPAGRTARARRGPGGRRDQPRRSTAGHRRPTTARSRSGTCARAGVSAGRWRPTREPPWTWPSTPTARCWPAAAPIRRCGCGTSRSAGRSAARSNTAAPRSRASPSAPTARRWQAAAGGPERIVASGKPSSVRLWDVATGQALGPALDVDAETVFDDGVQPGRHAPRRSGRLPRAPVGRDHVASRSASSRVRDYVRGVAFSPDGTTLASVGDDYDGAALGRRAARRPLGRSARGTQHQRCNSVAFSPDGRTVASGGDDAAVRLWDVASRRPRAVLNSDTDAPAGPEGTGRVAGILGVAFSPRGEILASAGEQGAVQLWDLRARRPLSRPLAGHRGWIRGLAFTPEGTLASAGYDRTVRLWDARGRPRRLHGAERQRAARRGGEPRRGGPGRRRHRRNGDVLGRDARAARSVGRSRATSAPSRRSRSALTARRWPAAATTTRSASGMSSAADRSARRSTADARAVRGLAFDHAGETLAVAGQDGTVRLWDVGDRRPSGPALRGSGGFASTVAFAPDDEILASAGGDGSVWLWDVDDRRPLGPPLAGHTDVVDAVAFSPDGETLASSGADGTVRLWDVPSGRALGRPLDGPCRLGQRARLRPARRSARERGRGRHHPALGPDPVERRPAGTPGPRVRRHPAQPDPRRMGRVPARPAVSPDLRLVLTRQRSAAISHSHAGTVVGTGGQPLMIASSCQ